MGYILSGLALREDIFALEFGIERKVEYNKTHNHIAIPQLLRIPNISQLPSPAYWSGEFSRLGHSIENVILGPSSCTYGAYAAAIIESVDGSDLALLVPYAPITKNQRLRKTSEHALLLTGGTPLPQTTLQSHVHTAAHVLHCLQALIPLTYRENVIASAINRVHEEPAYLPPKDWTPADLNEE